MAVVSTAAFHARVRGSVPGLGGLKETKNVSSPCTCESQYCREPPGPRGSVLGLRPPGSNFESCVWRTVSSHHPREVPLAQFSLYVHKCGLKPDSFHFSFVTATMSKFLDVTLEKGAVLGLIDRTFIVAILILSFESEGPGFKLTSPAKL